MYVSFDIVFFFKQKTAYDMRISDWSSDVCSSDLYRKGLGFSRYLRASQLTSPPSSVNGFCLSRPTSDTHVMLPTIDSLAPWRSNSSQNRVGDHWTARPQDESARLGPTRSEEHTSELQSLMRTSYSVFCLKQKKKKNE